MNVINFQDANCAHCYKCLRNCDIKAIRIKRGQAQIVQDLCIYCGHCMEICPQKAKTFESDPVSYTHLYIILLKIYSHCDGRTYT